MPSADIIDRPVDVTLQQPATAIALLPVNQRLCGREETQGWATPPVPSGQAVVLVQVDLPAPGVASVQ
ncbi:MAG: hypothetical protein WCG47_26785 [Dermatophilaceae bacterium]